MNKRILVTNLELFLQCCENPSEVLVGQFFEIDDNFMCTVDYEGGDFDDIRYDINRVILKSYPDDIKN